MTLTIELEITPEQEKALRSEALRRGLPVAEYAAALLEKHLPRANAAAVSAADPQDRSGEFREWAASHNMNNPLLEEATLRQKVKENTKQDVTEEHGP